MDCCIFFPSIKSQRGRQTPPSPPHEILPKVPFSGERGLCLWSAAREIAELKAQLVTARHAQADREYAAEIQGTLAAAVCGGQGCIRVRERLPGRVYAANE